MVGESHLLIWKCTDPLFRNVFFHEYLYPPQPWWRNSNLSWNRWISNPTLFTLECIRNCSDVSVPWIKEIQTFPFVLVSSSREVMPCKLCSDQAAGAGFPKLHCAATELSWRQLGGEILITVAWLVFWGNPFTHTYSWGRDCTTYLKRSF